MHVVFRGCNRFRINLLLVCIVLSCSVSFVSAPEVFIKAPTDESVLSADIEFTLDFAISPRDYLIYSLSFVAPYADPMVTFNVQFTASRAIKAFFTSGSMASLWELGHDIIVSASDYFPSTTSVSRTISTNSPGVLVFDNPSDESIQISGTVTVDQSGPDLSINLDHGGTYSGTIHMEATASDNLGSISFMQLLIDSEEVASSYDDDVYYRWETDKNTNGNHTVTVIAVDSGGNQNTIDFVITVSNPLISPFESIAIIGLVILSTIYFGSRRYCQSGGTTASKPPLRDTYQYRPPKLTSSHRGQTTLLVEQLFSQGLASFVSGDYEKAASNMTRILQLDPNHKNARDVLVRSLQNMKDK